MIFGRNKSQLVAPENALPGRAESMPLNPRHYVNGKSMQEPYPEGLEYVDLGLGCFWGAERNFWLVPGVYVTAVGYAGGFTPNPSYEEVCSGRTGHTEAVRVVFDPAQISFAEVLKIFWESHDPTQGMRQGNDIGTQYRSAIYCTRESFLVQAEDSKASYQQALSRAGRSEITTEIALAGAFYFAEEYHQQYLAKNPAGYCGLGGCGVKYPVS